MAFKMDDLLLITISVRFFAHYIKINQGFQSRLLPNSYFQIPE